MRGPVGVEKGSIKGFAGRAAERGFSFIELTAVIVILSIIAAVVIPKLSPGDINVQNGARAVVSDLMSARMTAMVTASPVTVGFSAGNHLYGFGTDRTRDLSEIYGRLFIETGGAVTFNSLGEPVDLIARQSVTVSDGTKSAVIYIEPYTGLVSLQ